MAVLARLIGLNLLVVMLWAHAALSGKASIYIDLPSIVFVLGVLVGGALLCFPIGQLLDAFAAAIFSGTTPPVGPWRRQMRIAVFARLYQLAWGGGLVAALLGLIAMLSDLSDPASIGAGMAVALVAPAYGALLAEFVFNPMQQLVMNQPPAPNDNGPVVGERTPTPVPAGGQSALFKGVAMIAVVVSMFMVPLVSFSEIKKEDAFSPQQEATYLRYLYGDDAPQSQAVSPRLNPAVRRDDDQAAILEEVREAFGLPDVGYSEEQIAWLKEKLEEERRDLGLLPLPDEHSAGESLMDKLEQIRARQERVPDRTQE